jgi:hypothetical protein
MSCLALHSNHDFFFFFLSMSLVYFASALPAALHAATLRSVLTKAFLVSACSFAARPSTARATATRAATLTR